MVSANRRIPVAACRVGAVLSALAIAGFLIWRAQHDAEAQLPAPGRTDADIVTLPASLFTSKSLVIEEPAAEAPVLPGHFLPGSKSGAVPPAVPPTPDRKQ